jgi:hypothetical protein
LIGLELIEQQGAGVIGAFSNPLRSPDSYCSVSVSSFVGLVPRLLVVFAALTLIVNGALPQLEMAASGGDILFKPRQPTIFVVSFVTILLLKGRLRASRLLPITLFLAGYLLLESLFLHFFQGLSIAAIRSSLEYISYLVLAGVASVVPIELKSRHILGLLLVLATACLIISAAQFLTNSPVIRTDSSDLTFHVQSSQFIDETRAFSLFANGLDAGVFYSFMGGIASSLLLRRKTRMSGLVLFPLCAFGCYATYTRLAMVGFVVSAFAVVVISKKGLARFSLLLPIFSLCCALLIVAQGLRTAGGAGRQDLANISSLNQRIASWGMYGGKFLAGTPADILFGIGQGPFTPYNAPDRLENAAPVPVDNAYLLVLLGSGLLGLAICAVSYWCFWTFLRKRAVSTEDHLLQGIAGTFAAVPFFCMVNDLPTQTIFLLLLALSLRHGGDPVSVFPPSAVQEHLQLA